jgi:uncharacterized protein (DUF302 family)
MHSTGVIIRPSAYGVAASIERLAAFVKSHGATIYVRIDQQREFEKVGISIPPFEFMLFGNPSVGAEIIGQNPLAALDLPLKIIAWEDKHGKVWLGYNDAVFLEERHALKSGSDSPLDLHGLIIKALDIHV